MLWSRSDVNLHHPQTATAGDTSGPGTAKYNENDILTDLFRIDVSCIDISSHAQL